MRHRCATVAALAAFLATASAPAAADAEVCVKRSGRVTFRLTRCKRGETTLAAELAGVAGVPGPSGDAGPQGPKGGGGLRLLNGTKQFVGDWSAASGAVAVMSPLDGVLVVIRGISPNGFRDQEIEIYHEQSQCGGPGFILAQPGALERRGFTRAGKALYLGDPVQFRALFSVQRVVDGCETPLTPLGLCCEDGEVRSLAGPAQMLDLATFGSPPFEVSR